MKGVLEEVKLEVCFLNEILLVAMVVCEGLGKCIYRWQWKRYGFLWKSHGTKVWTNKTFIVREFGGPIGMGWLFYMW
jgi:hypothetical protein